MGRSRGGLTSKIHAVVDSSGLPVRLALTTGEAHDNRLAAKLLSRLKSGSNDIGLVPECQGPSPSLVLSGFDDRQGAVTQDGPYWSAETATGAV